MQITSIKDHIACCEAKGVSRDASLTLLAEQFVAVYDYVLVHAGYAVQAATVFEVRSTCDLFDEIRHVLYPASA